ncbi:MAG: redoxin domain-containing protein [Amphritea sp.]
MHSQKLVPGTIFPSFSIKTIDHGEIIVGKPDGCWELLIVYRGKHCPLCRRYFHALHDMIPHFNDINVNVIAVSSDPQDRAVAFKREGQYDNITIGYELPLQQMHILGLYISDPRSPEETHWPFPEPGLFVIRPDHRLQIVDISNAPFSRPDIGLIYNGIKFIQENEYPIRGLHDYVDV